jgi:hypothetical protein
MIRLIEIGSMAVLAVLAMRALRCTGTGIGPNVPPESYESLERLDLPALSRLGGARQRRVKGAAHTSACADAGART